MTSDAQLALIQRGIRLLFKPGQLVEFRVRRADDSWRGFYFDNHEKLAECVLRLDNDQRVTALYYVINAVRPNLPKERGLTVNPTPDQVDTMLDGGSYPLTSNDDVENFNWMFIDVDTVRAEGFEHESSTKDEKAASQNVAKSIVDYLVDEKKWPYPLVGDSGNGWHILCRLDLLNTVHNKHLIVDCIKALKEKFECPAAKIDASVFNPARLTRAYGSTTRKGTSTEERPFRGNKLYEPVAPVTAVSLEQILNLSIDSMTSSKRKDEEMPELDDEFNPVDWIEFYAEKGAWEVEGERDVSGMKVLITNICPIAGHKHTGSSATGFIIGDSFGFHCFSDDCEGGTIGTIFRWLKEKGFPDYPGPVFKDDGAVEEMMTIMGVEEATEGDIQDVAVETKALDDAMAPAPEPVIAPAADADEDTLPAYASGSEALDGLSVIVNDLATHLLSVVFHHPDEVWQDGFMLFQKRIRIKLGFDKKYKKPEEGEAPQQTLKTAIGECFRLLLKFTEQFKRLPDKVAFNHFLDVSTDPAVAKNQFKDEVKKWVNELADKPANTFDVTAIAFVDKLDLRAEIDAWRTSFSHFLLNEHDIAGARTMLRKHFNTSTTQDSTFEQGTWQERTEAIYADFEKNIKGVNDERKFVLGFPSIDQSGMNIGLDGDRAICLCGPASNRKTTAALSIAMNFAIGGKNGLFFAGEHQCMKVLKRLTLQLGHFFKNDPDIGEIPGLSKWEGLNRTATEEDLVRVKNLLLKLKAGDDVPGFIEPQNINAVTQGEDDKVGALLQYAEATFPKYQWDFIIIDPLDTIMPPEVAGQKHGVSNWKVCSGIIDRLFDFSRNAFGGKGCMVIVSAQFGSDARREIEKIQEKNSGAENYDDELESILKRDGLIQYFTTIGQRFDLCLGIATRTKDGTEGLIVRGRDREGGVFNSCTFEVNPDTNYMKEKKRAYAKLDKENAPKQRDMSAAVGDDGL